MDNIETRKAEISLIIGEILMLEQSLGAAVIDYADRAGAMDIIARIERRMLAASPKKKPDPTPQRQEAAR